MIPKYLFQTSPAPLEPHKLADLLLYLGPDWRYRHFTDAEAVAEFARLPLADFPDMAAKFHAMPTGAHKADLFRYFHLYLHGGVFVDSDAMLKAPLAGLMEGVDLFTVRSGYLPGSVYQGFLGCTPGNPLMRRALEDAYGIDPRELEANYHRLCFNLFDFIEREAGAQNVLLLEEVMFSNGTCEILDREHRIVLTHYFLDKVPPHRIRDSRLRAAA